MCQVAASKWTALATVDDLGRHGLPPVGVGLAQFPHVNLANLFATRKAAAGSTRAMAERATAAGHPISHVQLGAYARGEVERPPNAATRAAIAAALIVSVDEVTAAARESWAPEQAAESVDPNGRAYGWLRLTEGRTDDEVRHLLGVAEAAARGMDAARGSGQ